MELRDYERFSHNLFFFFFFFFLNKELVKIYGRIESEEKIFFLS